MAKMGRLSNPEITWEVVKVLKELTKASGISQLQLARETGLSYATIQKTFNGQSEPSITTLSKIATELGYEIEIRFVRHR